MRVPKGNEVRRERRLGPYLFDRDRLRQIPRLIHIRPQQIRDVVRKELQGHDQDDGLQVVRGTAVRERVTFALAFIS